MVPGLSHPRWVEIAENPEAFRDRARLLSTKMLLGSLKIRNTREPLEQLIKYAHDYFVKNGSSVAEDLNALFK